MPSGLRAPALIAAFLLPALVTTACGSSDSRDTGGGDQTLTVYAASSLTATFQQLGDTFQQQHKGVKVTFDFGGSSDLVAQIQQGAPADVFASADTANMDKL